MEPDGQDRFDVVLKGFVATPPEAQIAGLVKMFGVQEAMAARLLAQLPTVVQRGVPRVRAEYFRKALALIGADAEVKDGAGQAVPPLPAAPTMEVAAAPRS